jgi:hypothetical protein
MTKTKRRRRRPYALSLRGYGADVRLDIDRAAAVRLLAWIGQGFGRSSDLAAPYVPPPALPPKHGEIVLASHVEADARHAFHHEHAPEVLRALYSELCDQLLDDAQIALDAEKQRRASAS